MLASSHNTALVIAHGWSTLCVVYIRFIGTHAEYNTIDVDTV
jgi:mRNA-degrading endonuclease HigB of HigAB toxin-antitoxin module